MDDFTNDRSTTGVLEIDAPISGQLEITRDVDWFHANLTGWVEIRIEALDSGFGTLANPVLKSIYAPNQDGRKVQFVDQDSGTGRDSTLRLLIDDANYFLAVIGQAGATGSYQIVAERFADHADHFDQVPSSILLGQSARSVLDSSTDRDIFRTESLRHNRSYQINVDLDQFFPGGFDWQVSIYDQNQNLQHQAQLDSRDFDYEFTPSQDGMYFVTVDSLGSTSNYDFRITSVDDQTGTCDEFVCGGLDRLPLNPNGSPVVGDIETWTDIDEFFANAWGGGYYVLAFAPFQSTNNIGLDDYVIHFEQKNDFETHTLMFTGDSAQEFEVLPALDVKFEIDVTGGGFADGKFEISLQEALPVVLRPNSNGNGLIFLPADIDDEVKLGSLFQQDKILDNQIESWQIWHQPGSTKVGDSGIIMNGDEAKSSNMLHTISAAEFEGWQIEANDTTFNASHGQDDLYVRGQSKGFFTPWLRLTPNLETFAPESQHELKWHGETITFSFMKDLPNYLNQFSGFQPLSESYVQQVRAAMNEWDRVGAFRLVEVNDHDEVDIRIGTAAFSASAYTHAAAPGSLAISGDILLNRANYSSEFAPGDVLFQRLMRSIGISLGISDILDGTITVADSIVRTYSPDGIYPWQPMRLDQLLLQQKYGLDTETASGNDHYQLAPGAIDLATIYDGGGYDVIDGGLFEGPLNISIHQGGKILTPDGTMAVGYGTSIERVNGGRGNDYLAGNELDNKVAGRAGNDFVFGMQGDDVLLGGAGDDRYGYHLGDGNDLINEQGHGGRDVLHIQSPLALNDAFLGYENIRFTKDGNDLILDLTLSAQRTINDPNQIGMSEGSLRIRNMADPNSAVEVLRLDDVHHNLYTPVISLESIYSRLADGQASFFQFAHNYDQWGVVPDFASPG